MIGTRSLSFGKQMITRGQYSRIPNSLIFVNMFCQLSQFWKKKTCSRFLKMLFQSHDCSKQEIQRISHFGFWSIWFFQCVLKIFIFTPPGFLYTSTANQVENVEPFYCANFIQIEKRIQRTREISIFYRKINLGPPVSCQPSHWRKGL